MFYPIAKRFAKVALGVYFRKIYLANMDSLPTDKPIILAANHPTAFIEPIILACWMDRPLHFLARGDLYVSNLLLRKIYDWSHMTPIFRLEDTGYSNLKSNYGTFEKCYELLEKNKILMILVEGRTCHEKRILPIRKGTARIVFGALEKHGDMDIHIVPVGVNYTNSDNFRSVAMIEFGEAIRATEYTQLYKEAPAKAVKKLTNEIGQRLKKNVIHIENKKDDAFVEKLFGLKENETDGSFLPVSSPKNDLLRSQKKIAEYVNKLSDGDKNKLKENINSYFEKLKKNNLSDFGLMHKNYFSLKNTIFLLLGFLPAIFGYLTNILPVWIGNSLAKKIAPAIEFRAATAIVFSSFAYLIYGAVLYFTGYKMGFGWRVFLLLLIPLTGYFYVFYSDIYKKWKEGKKAAKCKERILKEILEERKMIKKMVAGL